MKKCYFLIPEFILVSISLSAQGNIFPSSGNVGIGTTTPAEKLSIEGGGIQLSNPAAYPYGMSIDLSMPDYIGGWAREYCFTYNKMGKLFSFGVYVGNKEFH